MNKNGIIGGIVIIVILVALGVFYTMQHTAPATNNQQVTIRVSYNNFIDSLPFWVAQKNGYFNQSNITVVATAQQDGSLVSQALISGQADVGFPVATADLMVVESKQPGNFKLFLLGTETRNVSNAEALLVRANSSYTSVASLKGKRMGTLAGLIGIVYPQLIVGTAFNSMNMSYVTLPPTGQISALASNQVDAIWTVQPLIALGVASGTAKELPNSTDARSLNQDPIIGYAFSTSFAAQNPQTAKKIVGIINKAINYIRTNPVGAEQILANETGVPFNTIVSGSIGTTLWTDYMLVNQTQNGLNATQLLQAAANRMQAHGYLNGSINVNNMIYKP